MGWHELLSRRWLLVLDKCLQEADELPAHQRRSEQQPSCSPSGAWQQASVSLSPDSGRRGMMPPCLPAGQGTGALS